MLKAFTKYRHTTDLQGHQDQSGLMFQNIAKELNSVMPFASFLSALLLLFGLLASPVEVYAAEPGDTAPEFALPELGSDRSVALLELRGKVVYLDFWASWCGPCRKSLPLYEKLKADFPADSFLLVAINLDENREDAVRFLEKHPVSYPVLMDPGGSSALAWQIKAMPSSFLLDENGSVVKGWAGFEPSHIEEIRDEINALLD